VLAEALIEFELAYSPAAGAVELVRLRLPASSTARQALEASGLLQRNPALAGSDLSFGVWGRACEGSAALRTGDRLEVYRALRVDPKEARRQRYRGQAPVRKR
jgi:uncharacterized protein